MNDLNKTYVRSDTILQIEIQYASPVNGVYWKIKRNIFGKVIKQGWFKSNRIKGSGYWLHGTPENCVGVGTHLSYKPKVSIQSNNSVLERYFESARLANEFCSKIINDIKKSTFIEF